MNPDKTGGPAFPQPFYSDRAGADGMSLRDYFACQAMSAIIGIAGQSSQEELKARPRIASGAYLMADAMIKARETAKS